MRNGKRRTPHQYHPRAFPRSSGAEGVCFATVCLSLYRNRVSARGGGNAQARDGASRRASPHAGGRARKRRGEGTRGGAADERDGGGERARRSAPNDNDRETRHDRRRRTPQTTTRARARSACLDPCPRRRRVVRERRRARNGADGRRSGGAPRSRAGGRARRREAPQCRDADETRLRLLRVCEQRQVKAARRPAPHLRQPRARIPKH